MHEFALWAPSASRVDVIVDGAPFDMTPHADGWWRRVLAEAGAGTFYAFAVDGGPARPDPRSAFQPEGIDGPSAVVDHTAFAWTDGAWRGVSLRGAVLYELHIGTFTPAGTFEAAIDHLDHLVALGIDAVELLPVAEFSGARGWGYDGVDLFAPHHGYGGPKGLKSLVEGCVV
jgi:maltooligosyltrehalose trehalohydrolase